MRCSACNKVLENHELSEHPNIADTLEDLCIPCRQVAYESVLEKEEDTNPLLLIDELQAIIDSSK